jgi:mono/diheme cytochrome c family protein
MNRGAGALDRALEVTMRRVVCIVLAGAVVTGVASALAETPGGSLADVQGIFDRECVKCHGPDKKKAKLDLSAGESYKSLVNTASKEEPSILRVKPGDPEQSYLWLKLEHKTSEGDGMPKGFFGSRRLSQKDLDAIKAWIASGANP